MLSALVTRSPRTAGRAIEHMHDEGDARDAQAPRVRPRPIRTPRREQPLLDVRDHDRRDRPRGKTHKGAGAMTNIRNHPMAALGVLVLGLFMTLLDLTIVNVAIPSILDGLHASLDQVLWVLNAYSLLYAVLLITSARLGDIYGPRKLFAAGTVIFTAASIFSAMAQDPTQLILSRSLQGLGAAVLAPQGMPLMLSLFAPEKRGGVFAIYGVIAGLAVIAGPTVGGFLVTHFGWRSIFTVNLPIGIITVALAMLLIPDLRPGRRHRLDLAGVALATAGPLCVSL